MRFWILFLVYPLSAAPFSIIEKKLDQWTYRKMEEGFLQHAFEKVQHKGNIEQISFIAKRGNAFAGAVYTETFWGALHIKLLYLEPKFRGQGVGTELMEKAMQKGKEKGCRFAYVETFSFQALDFYKKLGFQEEFVRSGYDKESQYHYLKKTLF